MNKKYIHNVQKRMKNESRGKHSQTTVVVVTFYFIHHISRDLHEYLFMSLGVGSIGF